MKSKLISICKNAYIDCKPLVHIGLLFYMGFVLYVLYLCNIKGEYSKVPMLITIFPLSSTMLLLSSKSIGTTGAMIILTTELDIVMALVFIVVFSVFSMSKDFNWLYSLYAILLLLGIQMMLNKIAKKPSNFQILKLELRTSIVERLGDPTYFHEGTPCYEVDIKTIADLVLKRMEKDKTMVTDDFLNEFVIKYWEGKDYETCYISFDYTFDSQVKQMSKLSGISEDDLIHYLLLLYGTSNETTIFE